MHALATDHRNILSEIRYHFELPRENGLQIGSGAILFTIVGLGLLFITAVAIQPWVPPADLLRDPLAVAELSERCCKLYYGFVSTLGSLMWFMAAAICFFAGCLLYVIGQNRRRAVFMIAAALFTAWLGADDLFMVHDHVLPEFGVPQLLTYAVYGGLAFLHMVFFWREILQSRITVFLAAGFLLAMSVGIDAFIHNDHTLRIVMEDGAKLIGIALWGAFHIAAGFDYLLEASRTRTGQAV